MIPDLTPIQLGYIGLFGLTAVVCFGVISRARDRIDDTDTRWGLTVLLALSGFWSTFHVGRLVVPATQLKITFYILGLSVGLATVGAWLYFCSAYAGETYHRQRRFRLAALVIFVAVIAVKVTSPIHGLYFSTTSAVEPFPHLVIQLDVLHWVVTGLAYSLSAIGFYILLDLFQDSYYASRRLGVLVGLAGLPVVFDIIGYASPGIIITLNYEPVGVGLFAIGVLYVADGSFIAVQKFGREQLFDELDEAIVLLDSDGAIRDANTAACQLFPALRDSIGASVSAAVPELSQYLTDDNSEGTIDIGNPPQHYLLSTQRLAVGQTTIGRTLVFTNITEVERQRRELERQRGQLDDFAEAITHELRNTINIVQNHLQIVERGLETDSDDAIRDSVTTASATTHRMADIVSDLATLARFGHAVEKTTTVDAAAVATKAFDSVADDTAQFTVESAGTVEADRARLHHLFESLFSFSLANGATHIELAHAGGQLVVTDDGRPLPDDAIERAFTYGEAVPDAESGMLLPIVQTLAEAHGWDVLIDAEYRDGVCVVITL